ncbi:glycerol ethanol, ferric requiring protein [Lobulomyces angularis]|nr:glycerol ethanol, ferric requiring protein [Lobulomyces angularis]
MNDYDVNQSYSQFKFLPSQHKFSNQESHEEDEDRELYENFTTIDWIRDLMRDLRIKKIQNSEIKSFKQNFNLYNILRTTQPYLLIFCISVATGLCASWIDISAAWLTDIRLGYCSTEWYLGKKICCSGFKDDNCDDWFDWSYAIFGARDITFTIYGVTCATLVVKLSPYAAGSGTAEVKTILGGFIIKEFLSFKTLIVKAVGLPLTVASGLAVGKEGPMIHVACCIGNFFPKFFPRYNRNEAKKREILSASAAAGVAVAFGGKLTESFPRLMYLKIAPIGGVLFSLEELSTFFPTKTMIQSFFCALVSCVVLQFVDPYRGIFGGLSGAFVIRMNLYIQNLRKKQQILASKKYNWHLMEVCVITFVTAAFCFLNSFTRIDSSELLEYLFRECAESNYSGMCDADFSTSTIFFLVIALIMRMFLTIITFGVKVPSGIFIPSMVWGALFGRILGISVESVQKRNPEIGFFSSCHPDKPCVTPGMYSLLGAIAALGGVTRMTGSNQVHIFIKFLVSLTVIMFELTGTLNYIIPCMICLMVSKLVGDIFGGKGGMADILIRVNKYPFLDPRDDEDLLLMAGVSKAEEVMTPSSRMACFFSRGMKLSDVSAILQNTSVRGFPVIHSLEEKNIVGYISRTDLKYALEKAKKHKISSDTPIFFDDEIYTTKMSEQKLNKRNKNTFETESNNEHYTQPALNNEERLSTKVEFTEQGSSSTSFIQNYNKEVYSKYDFKKIGSNTSVDDDMVQSLNLTYYMDSTPLSVHPKVSVELVMDMFKKLGPRKIIVKQMGLLKGIITKKDLLVIMYGDEDFLYEEGGVFGNWFKQEQRMKGGFFSNFSLNNGQRGEERSHILNENFSDNGDVIRRQHLRRKRTNSDFQLGVGKHSLDIQRNSNVFNARNNALHEDGEELFNVGSMEEFTDDIDLIENSN